MKKYFLLILIFVSVISVFADTGSITLTNTESSTFYYILDPELESRSANGDTFTSLDMTKFTSILSGSSVQILNLSPGKHNVIGFWGMPGTKEYSVWSLAFSIEDGQSKTFPLRHKNIVNVSSVNTFKYSEIKIDNSYKDWKEYMPLAAFSKYYKPKQFVRQTKDLVKTEVISDSRYWGRGGTSIEQVKGFYSTSSFYLYFQTSSRMSTGLSFILYLFKDRKPGVKNLYTIEIVIDDLSGEGKVLLWQQGKEDYTVIGSVKSSSFEAEVEVDITKLPEAVQTVLFDNYSFDLVTNFFDSSLGTHEEFYYTTLYFKDMLNIDDVGGK